MATPGSVVNTGSLVGPGGGTGNTGLPGPTGPTGPTGVSANSGNAATLGSDNLIYVPDSGIASVISQRTRGYNAIGNPNFEIDQRNVGISLAVGAGTFGCDRWFVNKNGLSTGAASAQQVSSGGLYIPGTTFNITAKVLRITLTAQQTSLAAADLIWAFQNVEGPMMRELGASTTDQHSISILARSSVANLAFAVALRDNSSSRSLCKLCTLGAANTPVLFTLPNLPGWASGGNWTWNPGAAGYLISVALVCGSTYIPPANDTWQNGNFVGAIGMSNFAASPVNSTFDIGFVQHEPGPLCTALIDKPFDQNLRECKRYYQKSNNYGNKFVTNGDWGYIGQWSGGTTVRPAVKFESEMAKTPTLQTGSIDASAPNCVYIDGIGTTWGLSATGASPKQMTALTLGSTPGATAWCTVLGQWQADTGW